MRVDEFLKFSKYSNSYTVKKLSACKCVSSHFNFKEERAKYRKYSNSLTSLKNSRFHTCFKIKSWNMSMHSNHIAISFLNSAQVLNILNLSCFSNSWEILFLINYVNFLFSIKIIKKKDKNQNLNFFIIFKKILIAIIIISFCIKSGNGVHT